MKIEQTKCDYCGIIKDTPNPITAPGIRGRFLSLPIGHKNSGEFEFLDFCNEDCLRNFLVRKHKDGLQAKYPIQGVRAECEATTGE